MLINAYEQRSEMLWRQWMMWGGDWAEDMGFEQLESYFRAFKSLPIGLEIALTDSKTIGLIHAELPDVCDWREVRDVLLSVPANQVEANRITSDMLWNKAQPYLSSEERGRVKPVANIYHVFHGHNSGGLPHYNQSDLYGSWCLSNWAYWFDRTSSVS